MLGARMLARLPSHADVQRAVRGHVPVLDGVRGLAILLALVHNLAGPDGPSTPVVLKVFDVVTNIGWIGVQLFFVLSGFLITGILLLVGRPISVASHAAVAFLLSSVIGAAAHALLVRARDAAPLRTLGMYSYGIYVFHVPIANGLRDALRIDVWPLSPLKGILEPSGFFALGIVVNFLAAVLSYHLLEERFLGLKRFFEVRPEAA